MLKFQSPIHLHPGLPALTLADAFLLATGCPDRQIAEKTRSAVLMAAEHLYETTGPLTWTEMTVESFFAKIRHLSDHEQIGVALHLTGFYGWMISENLIPLGDGLDVMEALKNTAPRSRLLAELWQRALHTLPSHAPN